MACFYRAMMEELIGSLKQTHSVPLKKTDPPEVVISLTYASYFRNEVIDRKRNHLTLSNFW